MPLAKEPRRIAIVYEPESVPLLALAGVAARNGFHCVWVTDEAEANVLRRFGTVVQAENGSTDEIAERLTQLGVAGVTTFADAQLVRTAAIATRMGLATNTPETAWRLVDKIAQRQTLSAAGIPGPAFVGVHPNTGINEQHHSLENVRYPVVIKPAIGFGGRDTVCLHDTMEVRAELDLRRKTAPWRSTIVEECLGEFPPAGRDGFGDYVSVEVVAADQIPTVVAITGRMPLAEPFRETGAFLPCTLSPPEQAEVTDMAISAARALDVRHGCLHIEVKLTADGPRIIEVNGRVGGGGIADLVSAFTTVDLLECALRSALGLDVRARPGKRSGGVHYQLALQPPLGQRVRLKADWSTQLRDIPGLEHVAVQSTEAEAGWRDGSYGYLLMASGVASDHDTLLNTYRQLNAIVEN